MEMITTEKTEETVKDILNVIKSHDMNQIAPGEAPVPETVAPANTSTVSDSEDERFIYKFSETKNVTVSKGNGTSLVSIGKKNFYQEKVKFRGIHFPTKQWNVFKNHFDAIDEAINHFQSRNKAKNVNSFEALDKSSTRGFSLIESPLRFDGRSYLSWSTQMELFLKQLNLSYVISEPCPVTSSSQDWLRDDYMCHSHLMNSLSDHLYRQYLKKFKRAKELWDELKRVYNREESNSKRTTQVRKYIEFKMVEERPILEQVQDFNKIADSIVSAGMFLDETFHVSTIISKFPSSWSGFCTRLMEEEFLPVRMLLERVKSEEEFSRNGVTSSAATGSSLMETRPSLGTTFTGSQSIGFKRKEPERDSSKNQQ